MKKLFCLILFFNISILTFGANVYFLSDYGCIYTNGQSFSSGSSGRASVPYHLWVDPLKYVVDEWDARFQDPDGNWSIWYQSSTPYGGNQCLKAGTWYVQAKVHVVQDILVTVIIGCIVLH